MRITQRQVQEQASVAQRMITVTADLNQQLQRLNANMAGAVAAITGHTQAVQQQTNAFRAFANALMARNSGVDATASDGAPHPPSATQSQAD